MGNSLENSVHRVLLSSGIKKIKPFKIGSTQIVPAYYIFLAGNIISNTPAIKYSPQMKSTGLYNPGKNILWFKFAKAKTLVKEAVIVHEATHAVLDMLSAKLLIGDAEALAYIAQCQYFIINNTNPSVRLMDSAGEGTRKDDVFRLATDIAGTLLLGKTPTYSEYHELRQAVSNDPEYYWDFFTEADYDGI